MKKGFTMIELLGVIVISCILILIAVPIYNGIKKSINESVYESKIKEVLSKSEVYSEETNKYFFDIKTLIEEGYLTADNELEEYIDPRNGRNMVCDIIIVKDQEEIEIRKSEICYTKEELESIYGYVKLIVTDEKGTSLESTKEWYKKEKVWIRYLIQKENIEVEEIHWSGEEEKTCTKENLSACETYEIETSSVKNVIVRLNAKLKQKENEIESTVTKEINLDIQRPRVIEGSINIENEIRTDGKKKVNFELTDGSGSGVKEYAVVKEKSCNGKEFEEKRKSAKDKVQTEYLSNGDYYICVEDEVGNRTTESDLENENNKIHVENVDEGAPVIKKFEATSTNATYKAITVNLSIEATDDGGTNNLKMCISNTGYLKDCSWEKYNTRKNNWNVGGNLDGIERTIYLSIQDSTGKIANRQAKYTPYKEGSMTNKVYKGEWSNCSKACGGGIKTREYQIKDKYTNKVISSGQDKESCNTKSCDPTITRIGDYLKGTVSPLNKNQIVHFTNSTLWDEDLDLGYGTKRVCKGSTCYYSTVRGQVLTFNGKDVSYGEEQQITYGQKALGVGDTGIVRVDDNTIVYAGTSYHGREKYGGYGIMTLKINGEKISVQNKVEYIEGGNKYWGGLSLIHYSTGSDIVGIILGTDTKTYYKHRIYDYYFKEGKVIKVSETSKRPYGSSNNTSGDIEGRVGFTGITREAESRELISLDDGTPFTLCMTNYDGTNAFSKAGVYQKKSCSSKGAVIEESEWKEYGNAYHMSHMGNDKIVLYVEKTEKVNKKIKYYSTFLFFERQNDKWVKTSVVELPDDNHNKSRYGQLIPLNENTLIWNGSLGLYRISYE